MKNLSMIVMVVMLITGCAMDIVHPDDIHKSQLMLDVESGQTGNDYHPY